MVILGRTLSTKDLGSKIWVKFLVVKTGGYQYALNLMGRGMSGGVAISETNWNISLLSFIVIK